MQFPTDLVNTIFHNFPITKLIANRRISKGFKCGVSLAIEKRFKELSEKDFNEIKSIIKSRTDPLKLIRQITCPKMKEIAALVYASMGYALWNRQLLKDPNEIQENIVAFNDFLVLRTKFHAAITSFQEDAALYQSLSKRLDERSEGVQQILQFSDHSWINQYPLSIPAILKKAQSDNDRFYLALHYMFADRRNYDCEKGVALLHRNATNKHRLSQWVLGEYYFHAFEKRNDAVGLLEQAANKNPYFAYRLTMLLFSADRDKYSTHIYQYIQECLSAEYPLAYYGAGVLMREKFFQSQDHKTDAYNYFKKGAALGCVEAQREMEKMDLERSPASSSSCTVQ